MGTYDDESPDAGIGEKVANSIRKTVKAVADLAAPRSIVNRKQKLEEGMHDDDTLARMRAGQSTDSDNNYQ